MADQDDPIIVDVQAREANAGEETASTNISEERTRWMWKRLSAGRVWGNYVFSGLCDQRSIRNRRTTGGNGHAFVSGAEHAHSREQFLS